VGLNVVGNKQFVDITPTPTFIWFKGFNNGMLTRAKVRRSMFVFRIIATPDMTTAKTHSQMNPVFAAL